MRYYSKGYPQGLQGSPTDVTTSCISCVHVSPNLQVYMLNDRSRGLKTLEHVSSQKKLILLRNGDPTGPGKCSDTTCYALNIQNDTQIQNMWRKIPRTQNINYFIIQRVMFTCPFEGATSNRAELDYKIRHGAPRRGSLSFIYDSYMQYHGSIPWVLLIPSI